MAQTAINLYSVRDLDEPMLDILDRVADVGYDGVQISSGFRDATPAEVADRIEARGLGVTPAHIGIEALEDDLEQTIADYRDTLGVTGAVVPYLGEEHFDSHDAVVETAARLDALSDELAEDGWELHYHNHAHEFVDLDEGTGFELFVQESDADIRIELDVGWALVGGVDPAAFIREYGDRIDLLHMKDMDTSEERGFREIGDGDVDMAACADAGHEVGVDWLIYEHDHPADPAESIRTGADFLADL